MQRKKAEVFEIYTHFRNKKKDKIMSRDNGGILSTHRTEKEILELINTPCELTKEEIREFNKAPSYEEIQKSIADNGMGFITYGENHRDEK